MAIKTCTGTTAQPYVHVQVRLSQACTITATGADAPLLTNATGDINGAYSITLWANNDLTPNSTYYTVTEYLGTTDNTFTIQVPQTAGPFLMTNILVTAPTALASPNHVSTLIVDGTSGVAINAAGDVAARSFTASSTSPNTAVLADGTPTPSGVLYGSHLDYGGMVYNVKARGAKGDAQNITDGAMASGSAVLTSVSNKFAATDVGKLIAVCKAGALITPPTVAIVATDGGAGGSTLPTGNYTFVYTWVTGFGETTVGTSSVVYNQTVANHIIVLTLPALPAAAGAWKLYCTVAPGTSSTFIGLIAAGGSLSFSYTTALTAGNASVAPGANGASTTLVTTIASYQNAGQVTLTAANASGASVSAAMVDWGTDDTANINATYAAAALTLGEVEIPPVLVGYMISDVITNPSNEVQTRGGGVRSLFGNTNTAYPVGVNLPTVAPYLAGSVLIQTATGKDGFTSTKLGPTLNIRDIGVRFTNWFAGTGHGFNINPPVLGAAQDAGMYDSIWSGLKVFGHDGNHYGYSIINPLYNIYHGLRSYGGGFINLSENSGNGTPCGNEVFINPYGVLLVAGTAHGINSTTRTAPSGLILTVYMRPQVWVEDISAFGAPFDKITPPRGAGLSGANVPGLQHHLNTDTHVNLQHYILPDFETNVGAKAHFPIGANTYISPGIWSGGGYNDVQNNPVSTTSYQNVAGTGIMYTYTATLNPNAGAASVLMETSSNNSSWSEVTKVSAPIGGINGQVQSMCAYIPAGWWFRFTLTNATQQWTSVGLVQQGV